MTNHDEKNRVNSRFFNACILRFKYEIFVFARSHQK